MREVVLPSQLFVLLILCLLLLENSEAQQLFETFLEPNKVVDIATIQRERIAALHVQEGDHVTEGQLLVSFENSVTKARLMRAEEAVGFHGDIDAATALMEQRKSRVAVLKKLNQSGNARPQELESALTNLAMAEAQLLKAAEEKRARISELAIIQAQFEEKLLHSPIDGIVLKIHRDEAELVGGADQQPIMTLVQLDPLLAIFHLPLQVASQLKMGQMVPLAIGEQSVEAAIEFISPVIEAQSGTVIVRLHLPNPSGNTISGSRVTLNLHHP